MCSGVWLRPIGVPQVPNCGPFDVRQRCLAVPEPTGCGKSYQHTFMTAYSHQHGNLEISLVYCRRATTGSRVFFGTRSLARFRLLLGSSWTSGRREGFDDKGEQGLLLNYSGRGTAPWPLLWELWEGKISEFFRLGFQPP
jgi:hypothetical protein